MAISISKMKRSCGEVCTVLKALSHPNRLLVLGHLVQGRKTVSELVRLCEISQPQMSQFLVRLEMEGLVKMEKRGRYRVYSMADRRLAAVLKVLQVEYC